MINPNSRSRYMNALEAMMSDDEDEELEAVHNKSVEVPSFSRISLEERVVWTPERRSCHSQLVHKLYSYCDKMQNQTQYLPYQDPLVQKLYSPFYRQIPHDFSLVRLEVDDIVSKIFEFHHQMEKKCEENHSIFSHHFSYSCFFIQSIENDLQSNSFVS